MTSLSETLPILNDAVPALPTKVDEVAKEAAAFEQSARTAVSDFQEKRQQAEALVDQVRQALQGLHEQAASEQQGLEAALHSLDQEVEQETQAVDQSVSDLHTAGYQAHAAFAGLQAEVTHAGEQTRTAHDDARTALEAFGQRVHSGQPELEGAVHEMTAALQSAQHAITEGQQLVEQGVTALREHMSSLMTSAHDRLQQTHHRLEELRADQEKVVSEALTAVETHRQEGEHDVSQRLDADVHQPVDSGLDSVVEALSTLGQKVTEQQHETEARREGLEQHLTAAGERIPVLQAGVDQVKQGAEKLGISWP